MATGKTSDKRKGSALKAATRSEGSGQGGRAALR
jgi:hypothetical protein